MSSVYTPVAALLGDITLISDGDVKDAAGINTPIEAIADGVEYLNARVIERVDIFTTTGTWTPGANTTSVEVSGCGSGGGGGGGGVGNTDTDRAVSGGGGGGSAPWSTHRLTVTPAEVYPVIVSGVGVDNGGLSGADGTAGIDSVFGDGALDAYLVFVAGGGGKTGVVSASLGSVEPVARGGASPNFGTLPVVSGLVADNLIVTKPQGEGGCGVWSVSSVTFLATGGATPNSSGGAAGAIGTASGSYRGGGAGGGGGGFAHPLDPAPGDSSGGTGGVGNNAGNGAAGDVGDGGSGYGAGGGGGGGGGHGSGSGGVGGKGGLGGPGIVIVRYVGPQAVIA